MSVPLLAPPPPRPATSHADIDRSLATLTERAPVWAGLSLNDRIDYLRSLLHGAYRAAPGLVADACAAKGLVGGQAGDEWGATVVSMMRTMRILLDTLEGIRREGRVPLSRSAVRVRPDGQVTVRVLPVDVYDRILYPGVMGDVWVDPAVTRADLDANLGGFYTKGVTPPAAVSLVLGAGNVAAITLLDVLHKLFVDGSTVLLKHSRVAEYLAPHFDAAFADLISAGFVRTVYGGRADNGDYLTRHAAVQGIHLTGSGASYDAVVWGKDAAARKASGTPVIDKPVTCELGNVSPVIIVPGRWSERSLRLHAENVATQIGHNSGYNCNATRMLVMAEGWPQREAFLDHLRRVLHSLPLRPAYYPGAEEAYERHVAAEKQVEVFGRREPGMLPPTLLMDLDPDGDHLIFREEPWCPLAGVTNLPGDTAAEFLARAVPFCNERLFGTLTATVLADGATSRALGPAWDAALAGLRYGTVAVNIWSAVGFAFGSSTWGAFPGHSPADIGSGMGFVHNARLVDRPQKTVVRSPFTPAFKPPWFLTHRLGDRVLAGAAALEVDRHWWRLPRLGALALRG
ncbi:MAG: aldehyde dehydrogenase family protein [Acidimicrobiia bacterium]|nr:aldehyde dehydrogenase family protein [Acidimicrobiia bacterium]